jgi:hypothetical protein
MRLGGSESGRGLGKRGKSAAVMGVAGAAVGGTADTVDETDVL